MKKLSCLRFVSLFLLLIAIMVSCVKDEGREIKPAAQPAFKSGSDFGLPIYMSKTTLIGEAEIYIENDAIVVNVLLDDGYLPAEAHLYAGENAPPSPAPGLFPYHWNTGDDYPISFVIDISGWWDGSPFDWYFALHLEIGNETAWLLPEEGGTNWLNNAGKPIGWGQYFLYGFEFPEEFNVINLELNAFEAYCDEDFGCQAYIDIPVEVINEYPEFNICLKTMLIDIESFILTVPLMENNLNAFRLNPDETPFFYIQWDGTTHRLIDGSNTDQALLIQNFDPGSYSYTGTLLSENGDSVEITITFIFNQCP